MKNQPKLNEIQHGDSIQGVYEILASHIEKGPKSGNPYLVGVLKDDSAEIPFHVLPSKGQTVQMEFSSSMVKIRAAVGTSNGTLQLRVAKIRPATDEELHAGNAAQPEKAALPETKAPTESVMTQEAQDQPSASPSEDFSINFDQYIKDSENIVDLIEDENYRAIVKKMFDYHRVSFSKIAAAKKMHHAFPHGLLMHTMNMLSMAQKLCEVYGNVGINKSLLYAGVICHDLLKDMEYTQNEDGTLKDVGYEGSLLGHLYMAAAEVRFICYELEIYPLYGIQLEHLLISHHGKPEWGAVKPPMCVEAEILFQLDYLDSRIEMYREAYETMTPGSMSDDKVMGLGHKVYRVM